MPHININQKKAGIALLILSRFRSKALQRIKRSFHKKRLKEGLTPQNVYVPRNIASKYTM